MVMLQKSSRYVLPFLELGTLMALFLIILWASGALLEEWGVLNAFNTQGIGYYESFFPLIVLRPLHLVPYMLQWFLGHGHPFGVSLALGALLVLRYTVARWAVSPLVTGYGRWVLSTVAAVLLPWAGVWLGRFSSAQMSAVFFLFVFGFSVRLFSRWSAIYFVAVIFFMNALLMTYQGLAICLLAIPVSLLLVDFFQEKGEGGCGKKYLISFLRSFVSILCGFLLYALYYLFIMRIIGNSGYEAELSIDVSRLLTFSGVMSHTMAAFHTAYGIQFLVLPFFFAIVFLVGYPNISFKNHYFLLSIFMILVMLPILSIIYVSELHVRDPERVLYPVSMGFFMVMFMVLSVSDKIMDSNMSSENIVVSLIIISSVFIYSFEFREYKNIQYDFLNQLVGIVKERKLPSVMVRDYTGILGDVYTFLPPTLTDAMAISGIAIPADICTPANVDRKHPLAQRYPIKSTERCEDLKGLPAGITFITAYMVDGKIYLKE